MNDGRFLELVARQHARRLRLLDKPEKKRTANTDERMLQFYRMSSMRKCTSMSAAIDLCTKQFTDLLDMADGTHPKCADLKYWRDLCCDIQNYVDITLALAEETYGGLDD